MGVRVDVQCLPCAKGEFPCTFFGLLHYIATRVLSLEVWVLAFEIKALGFGVWGLGPFSKHAVRRIHGRECGVAGLFRAFDSSTSSSRNRDETEMFIGFVGTAGKGEDARRGGGGGSAKRTDSWKRMHMSLRVSIEYGNVCIYICVYIYIHVCRVCIYV